MKKLALVVLVGALAVSFTACSTTPGDPGSDEQVTITYSNFISNDVAEENLATIVAAFEEKNPGIKIAVKTLPYSDYFTALQTDIAAGTVADVFDIEYANYATYQANGVLAPLNGVDTAAYQKSLVEAYATGGVPYALPSSFSTVVLFYNKDLFDKAGLGYPTRDWTWEDEMAAAKTLSDPSAGVWGSYQPISYHEYYKSVAQAGGQFLKNGTCGLDSDAGIAAATWLTQKSGTVMPTAAQGAGTPDFDVDLFVDGKLAMWHTGIWNFGRVHDVSFAWDIQVEPGDTQQASAMFSNAIAVSATSKNQEAAAKWVQFMTGSDTMVDVRLKAGWELPPIADRSKLQPYLTAGAPANRQAVFDSLESVALAPAIGENQAKMEDEVTNTLTEIAAGRLKVETAIPALAQKIDALLK